MIDALPYESVTRIYLQSRDRYWMREGLSGFADTDHPMEIWDSTYGQPGTRGILMSYNRGPQARDLGRESEAAQLRFGLTTIEEVYPGIRKNYERGFVKVWDRDPWARGLSPTSCRDKSRRSNRTSPGRRDESTSLASTRPRCEAGCRAHSSLAGGRQPRLTLPEPEPSERGENRHHQRAAACVNFRRALAVRGHLSPAGVVGVLVVKYRWSRRDRGRSTTPPADPARLPALLAGRSTLLPCAAWSHSFSLSV